MLGEISQRQNIVYVKYFKKKFGSNSRMVVERGWKWGAIRSKGTTVNTVLSTGKLLRVDLQCSHHQR